MKTIKNYTIRLSTLSRKLFLTKYVKYNLIILSILALTTSCNSEDANDCLQTDGDIVTYLVELPPFTKIQMENDIRVILKEGPMQQVLVETGENLIPDLVFKVEQETAILQNNNGCNFLREYGRTLVTITSPNITFIRQASSFEIESEGTLTYPDLTIWSNTNPNSLNIQDQNKSGRVTLQVDTELLVIQANGSSNFQLSGRADEANINFSDEFPQLNARDFIVDDLTIAHTSAATMVVSPQNSITGVIKATGDVICTTQPPIVDVDVLFTGQLIFEN